MKKKGGSIKAHLLFPMLILMLVQAVLFGALLLYGGISQRLKSNAIAILNENTENSRLYVEKEIVHRWINIIRNTDTFTKGIQTVLEAEGKQASDIKTDAKLNKEIISALMNEMLDFLHRSYANGVFLVLEGPAAEKAEAGIKAGAYVRDLDATSYAPDNSDLLMVRGLPSIATANGIALDSFWELGFSTSEAGPSTDYYRKPFDSAAADPAGDKDALNYAYLSMPFSLSPMDTKVISYSIPLIMPDGTVVGVLGLDMTLSQLESLMDVGKMGHDGNKINLLGVRQRGENTIRKAAVSGPLYDRYFGENKCVFYEQDGADNISLIKSKEGTEWYASINRIEIYNNNTPFEEEEWVIVGMERENDLLSFYTEIRNMLLMALAFPLIFSAVGVVLVGNVVTGPIRKLAEEVRSKSGSRHLTLSRVHIEEIDELSERIENLSADVERSASKISTILQNANVPVGVFEYVESRRYVFCSRSLCEMLGWGYREEPYIYMPVEAFKERIEGLAGPLSGQSERVFCVGEDRWISMILERQEEGRLLGVLSDVTKEVLEKRKLERERNYDLLTNLYNRRAFRERVTEFLSETQHEPAAMMMWDLDNLKYVNDTYGHDEGDRYIRLFAEKLKDLETGGSIVSRYSGDEFASFLCDERGREGIRERIKRFMVSLQEKKLVMENGYEIPLRVSAGLSWFPEDAGDYDSLMEYADFAMYTVKHSVKGVAREFDRESYLDHSYLLSGSEELNRLFEKEEVRFAFQPIVDRSGEVYGYELLMRPELKKLKGIGEVLNLARAQAKLPQMEVLTWRAGLRAIDRYTKAGLLGETPKLFINSIASVAMPQEDVRYLEEEYSEYLSRIILELTESDPIDARSLSMKTQTMKRWGAMIAIDDFGSGYNSEGLLLKIAPDIVKIDMNLIHNIDQDENRQRILSNLVGYAKEKRITVLTEGVETAGELKVLMAYDIDLFQGYYIARPEHEIRPIDPYVVQKMVSYSNMGNL